MEGKAIYRWIKSIYPLPRELPPLSAVRTLADIIALKLSHFVVLKAFDLAKSMPLHGITHIQANGQWMPIRAYMRLLAQSLPYKDLVFWLAQPGRIPFCDLPTLQIERVCRGGHSIVPPFVKIPSPIQNSHAANHFTFPTLDISTDAASISKELHRLVQTRDRHSTLHFHIHDGGDLTVVHLLLRCLCGTKEPWMKRSVLYDSQRYHEDNATHKRTLQPIEYDPWTPWDSASRDYPLFQTLFHEKEYRSYTEKYAGNIILYVNLKCASAAWYLITYLIYAFATHIVRESATVYGIPIKIGRIKGNRLHIHGYSSTTSGDQLGDQADTLKQFTLSGKEFTIKAPTQAFTHNSVKRIDFNRFWMPTERTPS
jgi:hypothetical protein